LGGRKQRLASPARLPPAALPGAWPARTPAPARRPRPRISRLRRDLLSAPRRPGEHPARQDRQVRGDQLTPRRHGGYRVRSRSVIRYSTRARGSWRSRPGSASFGGGLVLLDHAGGDPAAFADRDAVVLLALAA